MNKIKFINVNLNIINNIFNYYIFKKWILLNIFIINWIKILLLHLIIDLIKLIKYDLIKIMDFNL